MRCSSATALRSVLRAAMPPNTLEVIRHSAGSCLTAVPNGQRRLPSTILPASADTT